MHMKFWLKKLEKGNHLEHLCINGVLSLKEIGMVWIELIWVLVWTGLWHKAGEPFVSGKWTIHTYKTKHHFWQAEVTVNNYVYCSCIIIIIIAIYKCTQKFNQEDKFRLSKPWLHLFPPTPSTHPPFLNNSFMLPVMTMLWVSVRKELSLSSPHARRLFLIIWCFQKVCC